MIRFLQISFLAASVALLGSAWLPGAAVSAQEFTEGKQYIRLVAPQPTAQADKIEVVELFWYGCPHCSELEPTMKTWTAALPDDVEFVRMPAVLSPRWELLARAYYAAELLGVLDKTHEPLFHAIHEKKNRISTEQALAKFFVEQGVDEKEFMQAYKSFGVAAKVNRAREMTKRYGINGVPAFIINGKFRTTATEAGGNDNMFKVIEQLISAERTALASKPAE